MGFDSDYPLYRRQAPAPRIPTALEDWDAEFELRVRIPVPTALANLSAHEMEYIRRRLVAAIRDLDRRVWGEALA